MGRITAFLYGMRGRQDLALIALLLTSVVVMIIPMPTLMVDLLLAVNITLTMLILIVAIYIDRPTSFSTFPAIILIATTFRLAISISTTRTILTTGEGGAIIETFGNFVTGGNLVVGLVIFLIITIVQFVVITKGAERVAEVAARFVLDALPGRQLSIDAELRAGDITAEEARKRRRQLDKENQFFGAMDGAMKFVKGDAIAGILIILINLIGGITIGTVQMGMPIGEAARTFSLLSIGDGLVCQIPALLLALCAGAVVTRVTSDTTTDLGQSIAAELVGSSRALFVAGSVVALLGLVPGFPTLMFVGFGGALAWLGHVAQKRIRAAEEATAAANAPAEPAAGAATAALLAGNEAGKSEAEQAAPDIAPKPGERLSIRVGEALMERIDAAAFLKAQGESREAIIRQLGIPVGRFGIQADRALLPHNFTIDLDGVPLFSAQMPDDAVAIKGDRSVVDILQLPFMQIPRNWRLHRLLFVRAVDAERIRDGGVPVLGPAEILAELGARLLRDNAAQIVGFDGLQKVADALRTEAPQLAEQAGKSINPAQMSDILRRLVDEKVPLSTPRAMFEALIEWSGRETDTSILAEHARRGLRRQLNHAIADRNRIIAGYVIEPDLENALRESLRPTEAGTFLTLSPSLANSFLERVEQVQMPADPNAPDPVIVTAVDLRRHVAAYLKSHNIPFPVISFQEVAPEFQVQPVGTLALGVGNTVQAKAA
jgi:type III secretion protein V